MYYFYYRVNQRNCVRVSNLNFPLTSETFCSIIDQNHNFCILNQFYDLTEQF